MTTDAEIVVAIRGEINGGRVVKRTLDDISNSGDKTTRTMDRLHRQMDGLNRAASILRNTLGVLGVSLGLRELVQLADGYTNLANRLRVVTDGARQFDTALREVAQIARVTQTDIKATADAFSRYSLASQELGRSQQDVLKFTQAIQQSFRLSGATATEAANAAVQLGQGLAAGALRGDEFRSVSEQNAVLLNILSERLGKTRGELIAMAHDGQLTAQVMFDNVLPAFDDLNKRAGEIETSVSRAFTVLKNEVLLMVGTFDKSNGISRSLSETILKLSENIELLAKAALAVAAAALPAILGAITTGVIGLTAALAANPLFAGAAILSAATTALILFKDEIKLTEDGVVTFGDAAEIVFSDLSKFIQDAIDKMGILAGLMQIPGMQRIFGYGSSPYAETVDYNALRSGLGGGGYVDGVLDRARTTKEKRAQVGMFYGTMINSSNLVAKGLSGGDASLGTALGLVTPPKARPQVDEDAVKKAIKEAEKNYKALQSVIASARTDQEQLNFEISEMERMRAFVKTAEDARGLDIAIARANVKLNELRIKAEVDGPVAKAFASLASEIDDGFKDAFKSAFTESEGGWKKMLAGMKSMFMNFLAELAYMAFAKPIVLSVIGGIGGAMGVSSGAQASILGTSGGGIGDIGSLLSIGKSFFGGPSPLTGAVNKIGSMLGIGGVGPNGPVSLSSMTSFTNGAWGGAAGAGLAGFGGNMLANAIFGGDRGIGSTIGGTIGTIAGSFIPVPILGPAIGGFLGNAIGGMFGGGVKRVTAGGVVSADENGGAYSRINGGAGGAQMNNTVAQALNAIMGLTGGKLGQSVGYQSNSGEKDVGTFLVTGRDQMKRVSGKASDLDALIRSVVSGGAHFTGGDSQLNDVLKRSAAGGSGIDQMIEDLTFAKQILEYGIEVDPLEQAMEALNKQFDELTKKAIELGLPTENLNKAYEDQKKSITESITAQKAGFASLEDMTRTFKAFLDAQALGSNSSLSPMQKLQLAQGNFDTLLTKARGGDLSGTPDLLKAAAELLDIGRGVYASTVSFAGLEQFVRSSVSEIAKAAGVPGYASGTDSASRGWAWVGEKGPELKFMEGGERIYSSQQSNGIMGAVGTDIARTNAQLTATVADMAGQIKAMNTEIVKMRKQNERVANKLTVAK